jgi:hypothetical protein
MSNLSTEREIAKFFAMSSVNIRPDACAALNEKMQKMVFSDDKRQFLNKFLKYFKEWQNLNEKSSQMVKVSTDYAILDQDTALKIFSTMNMNTST